MRVTVPALAKAAIKSTVLLFLAAEHRAANLQHNSHPAARPETNVRAACPLVAKHFNHVS